MTFYNILLRDLVFIHPRQRETPSRHYPDTLTFLYNIEHYTVWGCNDSKSVGKQIILGHDTLILSFIRVPCIA